VDDPCFGKHATDEVVEEAPVRHNYLVFHEKQDQFLAQIRTWNDDPASADKDIADFLTFVGLRWQ